MQTHDFNDICYPRFLIRSVMNSFCWEARVEYSKIGIKKGME
jgi:hypothetical protein